jgi:hypothetical protein
MSTNHTFCNHPNCYSPSPFAGIVCTICLKAIAISNSGVVKGIALHERNANKSTFSSSVHAIKSHVTIRQDIEKQMVYMFENLSKSILCVSTDESEEEKVLRIRGYLIPFLDYDATSQLYIPKFTQKFQPRPLPTPFDIELESNFHPLFWQVLQNTRQSITKSAIQLPVLVNDSFDVEEPMVVESPSLLTRYAMIQDSIREERASLSWNPVQDDDETTTNAWVDRVGWS